MKIDGNTPISLTVNLEMVQVILGSLGTQPYDRVANLVTILQQQTATQIQNLQKAQDELLSNADGTQSPQSPENAQATAANSASVE